MLPAARGELVESMSGPVTSSPFDKLRANGRFFPCHCEERSDEAISGRGRATTSPGDCRVVPRQVGVLLEHEHHEEGPCANEFETNYAPDRPEVVYCEQCYNAEIVL